MTVWVAYNGYGDLVADGWSYSSLLAAIRSAGYDEDEVVIGKVTP